MKVLRGYLMRIIAPLVILLSISGLSFAGYSVSTSSTTSGGGTWGSILTLSASISGSYITFTVAKQSGAFSSDGTMYLKVGSSESYGANRDSGSISAGQSSISFSHDLDAYAGQYPKEFYARYETAAGYHNTL